jgi:translation initiation factor 3 subunit H
MTSNVQRVEVDALVVLQIMKHCWQNTPAAVTGQLLGLDVDDCLQVTHAFGMPQKAAEDIAGQQEDIDVFQMEMQKILRDVNVDANTVGWYQTTHLGQFFSNTVIENQYLYQRDIPCSILLVYDPLQAQIGKPSFKALRLTSQFMAKHAESSTNFAALSDFPASEMFQELPVYIKSPAIVETFLVDWAIMDPVCTTQIESLDVENQVFLEKNMQLLISTLDDLASEQHKLQMFERQSGADKGKGKGRQYRGQAAPPRQLDTMILSQQIQNYCKQINDFSADSFGKLFLMSNNPRQLAR